MISQLENWRRRAVLLTASLLVLVPSASQAVDHDFPGFQIAGRANMVTYRDTGEPAQTTRCKFSLEISTRWWGLSILDPTVETAGSVEASAEFRLTGDGTNTYLATLRQPSSSAPATKYVGIVPDPIPAFPLHRFLWTIYVGGIYEEHKTNLNSVLPPWWLQDWEARDYFKSSGNRSDIPPFCFESLVWDHPGFDMETGVRRPFPEPFDRGFMAGELSAARPLQLNGLRIPGDIQIRQYGVTIGADGVARHQIVATFEAAIGPFVASRDVPSLPAVAPGTVIHDARLAMPELGLPFLQYTQATAAWPDTNDPAIQARLLAAVQQRQPRREGEWFGVRRWVAVVVVASILGLPLLFLWRGMSGGKNAGD